MTCSHYQCPDIGKFKCIIFMSWCKVFFHLNFLFVQCNNWRYPFDWRNPFGYLIAAALEYLGHLVASITMASVVHFHIGSDVIFFWLTKDVKHDFTHINEKARAAESDRELINEFNALIPFHSNAIELSKANSIMFSISSTWS